MRSGARTQCDRRLLTPLACDKQYTGSIPGSTGRNQSLSAIGAPMSSSARLCRRKFLPDAADQFRSVELVFLLADSDSVVRTSDSASAPLTEAAMDRRFSQDVMAWNVIPFIDYLLDAF